MIGSIDWLSQEQLLYILNKVTDEHHLFYNIDLPTNDEERLATALTTLLTQSRLHSDDWNRWLDHLIHWKMTSQYEREYQRISNVKNILSSLYFRLDRSDALNPAQNPWMESIKQHIHLLMKPVL